MTSWIVRWARIYVCVYFDDKCMSDLVSEIGIREFCFSPTNVQEN